MNWQRRHEVASVIPSRNRAWKTAEGDFRHGMACGGVQIPISATEWKMEASRESFPPRKCLRKTADSHFRRGSACGRRQILISAAEVLAEDGRFSFPPRKRRWESAET